MAEKKASHRSTRAKNPPMKPVDARTHFLVIFDQLNGIQKRLNSMEQRLAALEMPGDPEDGEAPRVIYEGSDRNLICNRCLPPRWEHGKTTVFWHNVDARCHVCGKSEGDE